MTNFMGQSQAEEDYRHKQQELKRKYFLRLALATIKDLKKSYMRAAQVRHNKTQWISDPELTKALGWFDKQYKEIYAQI